VKNTQQVIAKVLGNSALSVSIHAEGFRNGLLRVNMSHFDANEDIEPGAENMAKKYAWQGAGWYLHNLNKRGGVLSVYLGADKPRDGELVGDFVINPIE
jgi:hypothetical protein